MDVNKLKKLSQKKQKQLFLHLYGQMCNMDEINKIAKKNKIAVIEDCAISRS